MQRIDKRESTAKDVNNLISSLNITQDSSVCIRSIHIKAKIWVFRIQLE